jgi:iron complex outermembrane receptor protein
MGAIRAGVLQVALVWSLVGVTTPTYLSAQEGTVQGGISSEGRVVSAAQVSARRPDGAVVRRTVTGSDGTYRLTVPAGTYDIVVTAFGYAEARSDGADVAAGTTVTRDFVLSIQPFSIQGASVTAGRRPEKALEAPASITVVDVLDVESRHALSVLDHVVGVPGVDVAEQGIQARQVTTRGFNSIFGQRLTLLTDYRHASAPSLRVNLSQTIVPVADDIERVEVLRGPASALYGPSAADGVVHILTKSPFESQGASMELVAGGQSLFQGSGRYATALGENFAMRLSGQYFRGDEWPVTPLESELEVRDPVQERAGGELRVDGRFGATEAILNVGLFHGFRYVEQTSIGASQVKDWQVGHAQLRVSNGRLFAQGYVNWNDAGDTYTLQTLSPIIDNSRLYAGQVQHGFDIGNPASITYGVDLQRTDTRTEGTISGRNEDDDTIDEIGGYAQLDVSLTSRLRFVGAMRIDDHSRLTDPVWSPQAGLVFDPSEGHSIRLTYNRAFTPPVPTDLTIDLLAGSFDPLPFDLRARGVPLDGFTWSESCGGYCMQSPFTAPGALPLDVTPLWPVVVQIMAAGGVDLSAIPAPTADDVGTALRSLNAGTGAFDAHGGILDPIDALGPTLSNTFEAGYKGVIGDRVGIGADVYYTRRQDFRGQLSVVTPNAFMDTADLAAYLGNFMPADQALALAAVIGGVNGDAELSGIPLGTVVPDDPLAGTDVLMTYRNFGEIDLWGTDLSVEVVLNDRLTWSGTYSYISESFFSAAEIGEVLTLNAPHHKGFTSFDYRDRVGGVWGSLRARFVGGFRQVQGVWQGDVDSFYTIDAEVGAPIPGADGLSLSVAGHNLTDHERQEFVGAPTIGRLFLIKAQYRR